MKKFLLLSTFSIFGSLLLAQATKFALIEHYTNSRCGSCGANNPAFYAKAKSYFYTNLHHISYHPNFPYSSCLLYKANPSENDARTVFNGANFTPSYIINGKGGVKSVTVLKTSDLDAEKSSKSPLELKVKEISGVTGWTANIKVKNHGTLSGSNYVLMAALCEKTLNYNAPNGEKVHYDVFRKMLTNVNGNSLAIPAQGQEAEVNFNYTLNTDWNASEMYVVAWVVDATTKEVVNSGSKFTSVIVGNEDLIENEQIRVYPNPATNYLNIDMTTSNLSIHKYQIFNQLGQIVQEAEQDTTGFMQIDLSNLPQQQYLIKLTTKDGAIVRSFVKQ
jgi:hypothetical protein